MKRREVMKTSLCLPAIAVPFFAYAHHGWSSFDQERPLYLEGKVVKVMWQNPHAELEIELPATLKLPTDLMQRALPAQTAPVNEKAVLPQRSDKRWGIELAHLTRLQAWNVAEIKIETFVSILGFTFTAEKGDAVLRAEYLFVEEKTYGLRSNPA